MKEINSMIEKLLTQRGITDPADREEYLSAKPKRTYDPFLMKNLREGAELIAAEAEKGTKICVYGDYDADGVTSVCILMTAFSYLTDKLMYYIPSRFEEGYGMNREAVRRIHEQGAGLIVTVDCGITSCDEIDLAKELGMQVVVTDHHRAGEQLPGCIVIDPKQPGDTYPFRELAGCGVAYKLVQALQRLGSLPQHVVRDLLDIAAVGTVGDVVSLTDENRTIVRYGLASLNRKGRASLKTLEDAISLHTITSENIAFGITPHINAAGRMDRADEAVKLLMAEDQKTIDAQVEKMVAFNRLRKAEQEKAYKKSAGMLKGGENFICLRVEGIHEGIAGIAAGKLREAEGKPVILTTPSEGGLLKGTGRSIPGLDLFQMISRYRDLFVRFGGHRSACGFTIREENFETLKKNLEEDARVLFSEYPELLDTGGEYDLEISPEDVTAEFSDALSAMEPFGEGNPKPRFLLRNIYLNRIMYMGAENTHARFTGVRGGAAVSCVLFRRAQEIRNLLESGGPADMIGTISSQYWNGVRRIQFIVEEIQPAGEVG